MNDEIDELKAQRMEKLQQDEQDEPRVEVFTTPTCPYCTKLKQWLDREEIAYTEHDVAADKQEAMRMIQQTGQQGVPQTIIDGETAIVGFQPQQIKQALEG